MGKQECVPTLQDFSWYKYMYMYIHQKFPLTFKILYLGPYACTWSCSIVNCKKEKYGDFGSQAKILGGLTPVYLMTVSCVSIDHDIEQYIYMYITYSARHKIFVDWQFLKFVETIFAAKDFS